MAQAQKTFPTFEKRVVQSDRTDGYWIEAFHGSKNSDIVAYGLASGTISLFQNPNDVSRDQWQKTDIQQLVGPVGMDQADITGNGLSDVIICHHYGATMVNCDPEGGHIAWLENPGPNSNGPWKSHYIGRVVSMHRLRVGHFTRRDRVQVMALPIVGRPFDLTSPVHVVLFTQPDNVMDASEWPSEIVSKDHFHIIHDARVKKYNHVLSNNPDADLDSLLVASREGITWVQWNSVTKQWSFTLIGEGELTEREQTGFFGSGGVDVGKIGDDEFAYIPAIEPFHGNTLAVYIKQHSTDGTLQVPSWKRVVVDVYGNVDTHGEGPAHFVITGDFDGDGDDEFLVALRGPKPYQGVFCYKITNLEKCAVSKWHLSEESAARIAVADFSGDGTLDFATISYNVPGYYEDARPTVNVYYNTLKQSLLTPQQISIRTVGDGLRITVPNLENILRYSNLPFVDIGGTRIAIEAIPPRSSRLVSNLIGIKVLAGSIQWTENNQAKSKSFLVTPKDVSPLIVKSDSNRVTTGEQGAIIVTITLKGDRDPLFEDMAHVTLTNIVPDWADQDSAKHNFKWRKYWGDISNEEFYNVKGVDIYYQDGTHLCNTQFWTAGKTVDCGLHNHATDPFCEVHACIVNGTGKGGMTYGVNNERDAEQIALPVPTMYEHGPIWQINAADGTPSRRNDGSIIYPYHRWLAGNDTLPGQSFDVWMAIEFNPQLAIVPKGSK